MTGTYQLGYIQARNKKVKDPNCVLCQTEPEDEKHFIARCPVLEGKRSLYLDKIIQLTREKPWKNITDLEADSDGTLLTQLVIDCTLYMDMQQEKGPEAKEWYNTMEKTCRDFIYALHQARSSKIKLLL